MYVLSIQSLITLSTYQVQIDNILSPSPLLYIGWVGVGWQRHGETCRSLRELDNQGTFFFFLAVAQLVVELDRLCVVNNL